MRKGHDKFANISLYHDKFLYIMINLLINNNFFCVLCMKQLMKSQSKLW